MPSSASERWRTAEEDPSWTFRFMSEDREKFKFDELAASDTLLQGRLTHEGFAAGWPSMMEQHEGSGRNLPYYVAS